MRQTKDRQIKTVWGMYSGPEGKRQLEALGLKCPVVDGFQDMLDLNKLVPRMTPESMLELKAKQEASDKYGIQDNSNIRDVFIKVQSMKKDFSELPAIVKDHFNNDEFLYFDFLAANKENKYVLGELITEISGSDSVKRQLDALKRQEENKKTQELSNKDKLLEAIKEVITPKS